MPKIQDAFKTIIVSLPSYPESQVEIKTNISMGELVESDKIENGLEKTIAIAAKMIVKWNFKDENENDIPVSLEIINQLPAIDITFLLDSITPYIQKKTQSEKTS